MTTTVREALRRLAELRELLASREDASLEAEIPAAPKLPGVPLEAPVGLDQARALASAVDRAVVELCRSMGAAGAQIRTTTHRAPALDIS